MLVGLHVVEIGLVIEIEQHGWPNPAQIHNVMFGVHQFADHHGLVLICLMFVLEFQYGNAAKIRPSLTLCQLNSLARTRGPFQWKFVVTNHCQHDITRSHGELDKIVTLFCIIILLMLDPPELVDVRPAVELNIFQFVPPVHSRAHRKYDFTLQPTSLPD